MGEKKKYSNVLELNVMMIGGRRCGKTSVLAAMQNCFESVNKNTSFVMNTESAATDVLEQKRDEIMRYFTDKKEHRTFIPDSNPTQDEEKYTFSVGLKDSSNKIKINFVDIPGEWLTNGDKREKLEGLIAKSRILLVAIDTPHLMEEDGRYNNQRNRCYRICEMIKSVGFADADKGAGMILLVPLKCERYRNDGRMEEVSARTIDAYQTVIQYVKQPGKSEERSLCQVAVAPIFTMGGAAFDRFERDSDMEIIEDPKFQTPQSAIYYFPDMKKNMPEPLYCEQPLLYVLEFAINATREVTKKRKNSFAKLTERLAQILKKKPVNPLFAVVIDFLAEQITLWGGAEDFLKHEEDIRNKLKFSGDGYRIIIGEDSGGKC